MFIGHYAVGFASKRLAPKASLAWFVAAATLLDLLFPLFVLAGWESARFIPGQTPFLRISLDDYPLSHSLLMAAVWGVLLGGACWAVTRSRTAAVVVWLGVLSHWVLDFITHRPDLPLLPGNAARVGLGLWYSTAGTVVVEGVMFVAAVWFYARGTRARDRTGRWAFWGLVTFLAISYVADLFSSATPNPRAFAAFGAFFGWLFVGWAWWLDRHRDVVSDGRRVMGDEPA